MFVNLRRVDYNLSGSLMSYVKLSRTECYPLLFALRQMHFGHAVLPCLKVPSLDNDKAE